MGETITDKPVLRRPKTWGRHSRVGIYPLGNIEKRLWKMAIEIVDVDKPITKVVKVVIFHRFLFTKG